MGMASLLERINGPADLKGMSIQELEQVAGEIRELVINTVSKTGGHLAANLGVVELTLAMLKVFNPPDDKLIWDVSHQTYVYKILTGRRKQFNTLRQYGGIAGFSKREESEYDVFGAGHSGTALSAALGMAVARDRRGSKESVVAILGDGALGCGISLEALNNVHETTGRLVVILNDNEMSIAANVGSMSRYMGDLLINPRYNRWKKQVETVAWHLHLGWLKFIYYRIEEALKGMFVRSLLFEEFGLRYIGPVDGHNIHALLDALTIARDSDRPIVIHVSTQKGRGYTFAEEHPEKWHGAPQFDVRSGEPTTRPGLPSYSWVVGKTLERIAADDKRIVAITAGMASGTGLTSFSHKFADRFFDVGITEEHAVVFAAGMATQGMIPVFAVYSTFLQRAIDCVIHDVCLQNLPVVLCIDRAGIVGDDGPTHHGVFDIPMLAPIPGLVFMQPKDEAELANMLCTAVKLGKPAAIRYPRGAGPGAQMPAALREIEIGRAELLKGSTSEPVCIWALGDMIPAAMRATDLLSEKKIGASVVNPRFIRPLDEDMIAEQAKHAKVLVTIENGVVKNGFGSIVADAASRQNFRGKVLKFGWPDEFIPQGAPDILLQKYGLTARAVATAVEAVLGK